MSQEGKLIVIVAPSGTGKSTLIKKIKQEFPQVSESISYTTREQREGEKDGESYHFIAEERFKKMIEADEFLEWAKVHSNYYGTSKRFVDEAISRGENLLFDLDVQGCDSMSSLYPNSQIIFIEPPSLEELENRLGKRGTDSTEIINKRIENAKAEIKRKNDFDYNLVNDDFEKAYANLRQIFKEILRG